MSVDNFPGIITHISSSITEVRPPKFLACRRSFHLGIYDKSVKFSTNTLER